VTAKIERSIADSILLQLVEQGAVADFEPLGGVRAIAARRAKRPTNQVYFESPSATFEA
jgi:hypothetical protein